MPLQEYFELIDHHFEVCIIITHIIYNPQIHEREIDAIEEFCIHAIRLCASRFSYVNGGFCESIPAHLPSL